MKQTKKKAKKISSKLNSNMKLDKSQIAGSVKATIRLANLDWDELYKKDIESGNGFDIDDVNGITKKNERSERGIYSPLYGGNISSDAVIKQYSCNCGELYGKFNNGRVCKKCGTKVTYRNTDMKKTGWMTLREELHLINPLYYFMLEKVIGKKDLYNIIFYNKKRDKDGNVVVDLDYFDENNPFCSIGMKQFYERFDEIMAYYKDNIKGVPKVREEKIEMFKFLEKNKEKIFCNHFPVYSLSIRPIMMVKDNLIFDPINAKFQSLLVNVCNLNNNDSLINNNDLKVLPLLFKSQLLLNKIHKSTIEQVSTKKGHIRSSILGERVNYSSRCVIVPLIGKYNLNEIKLPYLVFLELYKYEIINLLTKMDKLSIAEANKRWHKATTKFDRRIYLIMKHIIDNTEGGLYCFINRNPSLNLGSLISMRVVDVKEDYSDLTLNVPVNILGLIAGDFDGDVLNIISLKSREFVEYYNRIYSPIRMMIDRNDGYFNRKMNLIKDQMIGLYAFCKD